MQSRAETNQEVMSILQEKEEQYGVEFILVQIQSASPPGEVVDAIKNRMVAEQLQERADAEASQQRTLADSQFYSAKKKAEGDAYQITSLAEAQANALRIISSKSYAPAQRDVYRSLDENLRLVDYVTFIDGTTYINDGAGPEHAVSVAGALCWSYYFGRATGDFDTSTRTWAQDLYRTYDLEVNEWTRPDAPASGLSAYRNSPPRRYNWQYRTTGSLSWCMSN